MARFRMLVFYGLFSCLLTVAVMLPACDDGDGTATTTGANTQATQQKMILVGGNANSEPLTADEGQTLVVLDVEGMHCGGCESAISDTVKKLPGVVDVSASHTEKKAWVVLEQDAPTDAQTVADRIESLADGKLYQAKVTQ